MPQEGFCPTCKCNVVITQQGTCPLGHPIDAAAIQPPPQAAVTPAPTDDTSVLPPPDESDSLSAPAPQPMAAQDTKRRVSPVLIILLVMVLALAIAGAAVFFLAPDLIGMGGEDPTPLPPVAAPAEETNETAATEAEAAGEDVADAFDLTPYMGGNYQWHTEDQSATFEYIVFLSGTEVDLAVMGRTVDDARGTWVLEGDVLTLVHPDGVSARGRILELNETTLVIEGEGSYGL